MLVEQTQTVPQPVRIRALVDTGASCTCIDPESLAPLQLTPTGTVAMSTPSTGTTPHQTEQFDIALIIPGATGTESPLYVPTLPVVSSVLKNQGIDALIGRDLLKRCTLHYNGTTGLFTVAY